MSDVQLRVDARSLYRKLRAIEPKEQRKIMRTIARQNNNKYIKPAMKDAAPMDTGRLRRSIKTRSLKRSRNHIGSKVSVDFAKHGTYYANPVEFGYVRGLVRVPGRFFQRDTYNKKGPVALRHSTDALAKALVKA